MAYVSDINGNMIASSTVDSSAGNTIVRCTTAAATTTKTISYGDGTTKPAVDSTIHVYFSYGNTVASPVFSINGYSFSITSYSTRFIPPATFVTIYINSSTSCFIVGSNGVSVVDSTSETSSQYNPGSHIITRIPIGQTSSSDTTGVSIPADWSGSSSTGNNSFMSGVVSYGNKTYSYSIGSGNQTYNPALLQAGYPLGVIGWDSTQRHIICNRAYISGITKQGNTTYTGNMYKCDLNYLMYNCHNSAHSAILYIYILWARL